MSNAINNLKNQILGQGTTGQWSGQGFGSAEANAEDDKKQRELIEARNRGDSAVHQTRTDLEEVRGSLTTEQIDTIETACIAVETACKENDQVAITQKVSDLMAASQPIFEAKSKSAEAPTQAETSVADDVVDADFTEKK
jgi:molecular chaperone DnaK